MGGTVLVLGGRSEIGIAVAERLAGREAETVVLAASGTSPSGGQPARA